MMVSTKGRYALRVMIDLAQNGSNGPLLLMDIAQRQQISEKYLEGIMAVLSRHGFVSAQRGRGGGYRLTRSPEQYTVGSILKLIEGSLAPVSCLDAPVNSCPRAESCLTLPMWSKLNQLISDYLESVTIADLMAQSDGSDHYVI